LNVHSRNFAHPSRKADHLLDAEATKICRGQRIHKVRVENATTANNKKTQHRSFLADR
jgi:DNA-binding transcriptional regulator WhiA